MKSLTYHTFTLATAAVLALNPTADAQYDVHPGGSFSPPGHFELQFPLPSVVFVETPYQLVRAAVPEVPGGVISIAPGEYRESGVYSAPAVLAAADGGVVTIGNQDVGDSTTLRLCSLNTHMAGDTLFEKWKDSDRTRDIADICKAEQWDFVAFSEMWDEDFFCDDCCSECGPDGSVATPLLDRAGYPFGRVGDDDDCFPCDTYHSGLAVMSLYPILSFIQGSFDACSGDDCFANKGFVVSTIQKDGFDIIVINTHMQAYDNVATRRAQMDQINAFVTASKLSLPNAVFFIVGDFNVPGETLEFDINMREAFPSFHDAVHNSPGFVESEQVTNDSSNPLATCFDCGTYSSRLDYILYTPQSLNGSVKVVPRDAGVYKFLGGLLTDSCSGCPSNLATNEKSDHWAVEGEFEIFRP